MTDCGARQLLAKLSVAATDTDRRRHPHLQQQVRACLVLIHYLQQRIQLLGTGTPKKSRAMANQELSKDLRSGPIFTFFPAERCRLKPV